MAGKTVDVKCACCSDVFTARVADRKRGWAKFCSKRCKAIGQMRTHGDTRKVSYNNDYDPSWDAHKYC